MTAVAVVAMIKVFDPLAENVPLLVKFLFTVIVPDVGDRFPPEPMVRSFETV